MSPAHLEHRAHPLVADDLDRAVERAIVQPLVRWLLCLHLQATADGVERVGDEARHDRGELRDAELGGEADDALLLLERVLLLERIEDAEVRAAVRDDPDDRHREACGGKGAEARGGLALRAEDCEGEGGRGKGARGGGRGAEGGGGPKGRRGWG